jgi:DNA-binding IclR family transcriptional regulator
MKGAQAVERAISILRLLGQAGTPGLRLVDIEKASGLARPTAHRLLNALVRGHFAAQASHGKRYVLGPEIAVLGWSITQHGFDLRELCQPSLMRIAQKTGDTALLMVRSGDEAVCVDVKLGPYPVKTMTVEIGARRPLVVGATGLAILAALPQEEAERVLSMSRQKLRKYPHLGEAAIRKAMRGARADGYAVSDGLLLPNVRGVAVAITERQMPVAALGVAAIRERMSKSRIASVGRMLDDERRHIESRIAQLPRPS